MTGGEIFSPPFPRSFLYLCPGSRSLSLSPLPCNFFSPPLSTHLSIFSFDSLPKRLFLFLLWLRLTSRYASFFSSRGAFYVFPGLSTRLASLPLASDFFPSRGYRPRDGSARLRTSSFCAGKRKRKRPHPHPRAPFSSLLLPSLLSSRAISSSEYGELKSSTAIFFYFPISLFSRVIHLSLSLSPSLVIHTLIYYFTSTFIFYPSVNFAEL